MQRRHPGPEALIVGTAERFGPKSGRVSRKFFSSADFCLEIFEAACKMYKCICLFDGSKCRPFAGNHTTGYADASSVGHVGQVADGVFM
jgi:hypothetical protein